MGSGLRSGSGQATVDYVAIIALLALVLTGGLASTALGAPGIVNAMAGQFRHALCLIGGGPCPDRTSKPCTVATSRKRTHFAVTLLVVRYDREKYLLREEMSDGSVQLTVATTHGGGVEVGLGASAHLTLDGHDVGARDEARLAGQLQLGSGKVYVARDARQADAFVKVLRSGGSPGRPSQTFDNGGARALGHGSVGAGTAGVSLQGLASLAINRRRDLGSGETTYTLRPGVSGWSAITLGMGPAAGRDKSATLGLTLDRHHRATALSVHVTGTVAGGGYLPRFVTRALRAAPAGGGGSLSSLRGRRWEVQARLDLRDPVVAGAWTRFRDHPTSPEAIAALGSAMHDQAYLDVRTYATHTTSGGAGAGIAGGVRLAAEYDHGDDSSRLVAAASRPPGGLWEPRIDCVKG